MINISEKFEILWWLHGDCNYQCPYCSYNSKTHPAVKPEKMRETSADRWIRAWEHVYDNFGESIISVTGDFEPTLYPGFFRILESMTNKHDVYLDTNLSMPEEEVNDIVRIFDPSRLVFHTSFHPYCTSKEAFAAKLKLLKNGGFSYECRCVGYPPILEKLEEFYEYFLSMDLTFTVTPYQGVYENVSYPQGYSTADRERFMGFAHESKFRNDTVSLQIIEDLFMQNSLNAKDRLCRSGYAYACITCDGEVHRCRGYALYKDGEPFGNIFREDIKLNDSPQPCELGSCGDEYRWVTEDTAQTLN